MGIGISVFLIAVGAILAFAVELSVSGVDLAAVGIILMIVGAIGLVVALAASRGLWGPGAVREDTYVDDGTAPPPRRTVRRRTYVD